MSTIDSLVSLLKELQDKEIECEWIEYKVNNSDPFEIGKNISALSNSACYHNENFGYLVYGIEDETKKLVGTDFRPKTEKKGNQELENWLATQLNPRIDFLIMDFDYNGLHFVIFRISATINTPVSFKGESFIRIGTYNKSLDQHPERERKIWTSSTRAFEKLPSIINISEDEALDLITYQGYFNMIDFPIPSSRSLIIHKLIQDKILEKIEGQVAITNLGALLFARNIESFENLSRKALRVVVYDGLNRIQTKKEQIGRYGFAVAFEGLMKFINDLLPSKEVIGEAFRKTQYTYPPLAIRELVANAIIHQDFNVSGTSAMVEIFDNRIEITNPGKPLIDPLRFVDHSPQSRNETLARFMRRLNICEERGSGIDKVVFECELHQLPAPSFIVGENYTRVILYSPKPLREMDKEDKIRACYQHACLKYVSGEIMTNQSLRERLGVEDHNYSTVSRIIADTKDAELIKDFDPRNKSKTYSKYLPFWA